MLVLKSLLTTQKQDRQKDTHIRPDQLFHIILFHSAIQCLPGNIKQRGRF